MHGLGETNLFDFDFEEEVLPEDSWMLDNSSCRYEIDATMRESYANGASRRRKVKLPAPRVLSFCDY